MKQYKPNRLHTIEFEKRKFMSFTQIIARKVNKKTGKASPWQVISFQNPGEGKTIDDAIEMLKKGELEFSIW